MRLIKIPKWEKTIEVNSMGGGVQRIASHTKPLDVEIVVPDKVTENDDKNNMWNVLKYGSSAEKLADAFKRHQVSKVAFPDDGIVLHGVYPYEVYRTEIWKGRIYKCKVDYFEVTDDEAFARSNQSQL